MKKSVSDLLFISDLDGTLLDHDARLPQGVAERINRLTAAGVKITYSTARTIRSVSHILADVDFSLPGAAPVSLMNGVMVRDMAAGSYVRWAAMPRDRAEELLTILTRERAEPFVYAVNPDDVIQGDALCTWYRRTVNDAMEDFLRERETRWQKPFRRFREPDEIGGEILYFCVLGEEALIRRCAAAVDDVEGIRSTHYADAYRAGVWYLEIFSEDASKKHAAEFLRRQTGARCLICFGDNRNDLPMFEAADVAVAVTGAVEEVRRRADTVTDDVVEFIENYVEEYRKEE